MKRKQKKFGDREIYMSFILKKKRKIPSQQAKK